jgi:hypothetical protein
MADLEAMNFALKKELSEFLQMQGDMPMGDIYKLINYVFVEELKNFEDSGEPDNHIFRSILSVKRWWSKHEYDDPDFFPFVSRFDPAEQIYPIEEQRT